MSGDARFVENDAEQGRVHCLHSVGWSTTTITTTTFAFAFASDASRIFPLRVSDRRDQKSAIL
jgi:hypothetical protein